MIEGPYFVLVVLSALACGVSAGVFIAFSAFVMKGLAALPPERGIAAMQAINAAAVNPAFLVVFLGAAALCAVVAVVTFVLWPDQGTVALLLGSALQLVGAFGVTVVANVPRNEALSKLDPDAPDSVGPWRRYASEWLLWNHVRGAASLAASAAFVLALT
ncbi:DUF1772 domain-containing protein [Streptomyces antnestii]|uniref:DUF1772 domain-containing protein n=1 Tax=Streptomyces antnestii TaxID=2494256 RepID=A0A3S2XSV6_9ACTN|nr:anthrone oxygenase family protein [Streptomyces sp. San01]RVU22124.1 DUF1772 domain-containing protein [Streptomyces sp. San01]